MSNISNLYVPPLRNPELMSILRIHIANCLASRYGIQNFTRDSIEELALHIYQCISKLILHIKSIVTGQGRTIPNFLHLLASYQIRNQSIDFLLIYLISRARIEQQNEENTKKYQVKNLLKQDIIFSLELPEKDHDNIFSFPSQLNFHSMKKADPLPVHKSMNEVLDKPPLYSYAKNNFNLNRELALKQIVRQSNFAQSQMKMALAKKNKIKIRNDNKQDWKYDPSSSKSQCYSQKMKFQLCKYL